MLGTILALNGDALAGFILGGGLALALAWVMFLLLVYGVQLTLFWIDDCENRGILDGNWFLNKIMSKLGWDKRRGRVYAYYMETDGYYGERGSDGLFIVIPVACVLGATPLTLYLSLMCPSIAIILFSFIGGAFILKYARRQQKKFVSHMEDRMIHKRRDSE